MKQVISVILLLSINHFGFTQEKKVQHFLEVGANASLIRLNGELNYHLNVKRFALKIRCGYGQIGKKSFLETSERDGYGFISSGYYLSKNYYSIDFTHDFVGFNGGFGLGTNLPIGEKHGLCILINIDYFHLKDKFSYRIKDKINNTEQNEKSTLSSTALSLGLGIDYYYKISNLIALKCGVNIPVIGPFALNSATIGYNPQNKKLPLYGVEPYMSLGVQFNLSK